MKASKETGRARAAVLGAVAGIVGYQFVSRMRARYRAARRQDAGAFVHGLGEADSDAELSLTGREIYGHAVSPRLVPAAQQPQGPIEHPDDRVDAITEHGEIAKAEYSTYWSPEQRVRAEPERKERRPEDAEQPGRRKPWPPGIH